MGCWGQSRTSCMLSMGSTTEPQTWTLIVIHLYLNSHVTNDCYKWPLHSFYFCQPSFKILKHIHDGLTVCHMLVTAEQYTEKKILKHKHSPAEPQTNHNESITFSPCFTVCSGSWPITFLVSFLWFLGRKTVLLNSLFKITHTIQCKQNRKVFISKTKLNDYNENNLEKTLNI